MITEIIDARTDVGKQTVLKEIADGGAFKFFGKRNLFAVGSQFGLEFLRVILSCDAARRLLLVAIENIWNDSNGICLG